MAPLPPPEEVTTGDWSMTPLWYPASPPCPCSAILLLIFFYSVALVYVLLILKWSAIMLRDAMSAAFNGILQKRWAYDADARRRTQTHADTQKHADARRRTRNSTTLPLALYTFHIYLTANLNIFCLFLWINTFPESLNLILVQVSLTELYYEWFWCDRRRENDYEIRDKG